MDGPTCKLLDLRASVTIFFRDLGLGTKPPTTLKSILDYLNGLGQKSSTALSRSKIKRAASLTTCQTKERSKSIALFKIKNYTIKTCIYLYNY